MKQTNRNKSKVVSVAKKSWYSINLIITLILTKFWDNRKVTIWFEFITCVKAKYAYTWMDFDKRNFTHIIAAPWQISNTSDKTNTYLQTAQQKHKTICSMFIRYFEDFRKHKYKQFRIWRFNTNYFKNKLTHVSKALRTISQSISIMKQIYK